MIGEEATTDDVKNFFDFIFSEDYFASPLTNALLLKFPLLRYTPLYKSEFEKVIKARSQILEKYFWNMKVNIYVSILHYIEMNRTLLIGGLMDLQKVSTQVSLRSPRRLT